MIKSSIVYACVVDVVFLMFWSSAGFSFTPTSDIHFQYNGFLFGFLLLSVAKHLQVQAVLTLSCLHSETLPSSLA